METIKKHLVTLRLLYSNFRSAGKKDKIFLIVLMVDLTMTFGGIFLGLLTGTHIESAHATAPNPYLMVFGTAGFALAGAIVIVLSWRTEGWPMSVIGGIIFIVGVAATMVTIDEIFPFRFILSTGNMKADEMLYASITFLTLCLLLEIFKSRLKIILHDT